MFFSLIKEKNKLIGEWMRNTYFKVTIEKNWRSQNFDFLSVKNSSADQLLGSSNIRRYHQILKFLLQIKSQRSWNKSVCCFSIILIRKGIMTF